MQVFIHNLWRQVLLRGSPSFLSDRRMAKKIPALPKTKCTFASVDQHMLVALIN